MMKTMSLPLSPAPRPVRGLLLALGLGLAPLGAGAASAAGAIAVVQPWIVTPPNGAPTAAGYLTIKSDEAQPDQLLGASSDLAQTVQIHAMTMDGEVMRMREIPGGLPIPARGVLVLSQGGERHLMFIGPKRPFRTGDHVPATLRFKNAGSIKVDFMVRNTPPAP